MNDVWNCIERWLQQHLPQVLEDLNPGATEADFAKLEARLGTSLPEDFKAFYRIHNGQQAADVPGLFFGMEWMSLEHIWEHMAIRFDIDPAENISPSHTSIPAEAIAQVHWGPLWIPFSHDWGSNYLGIDLQPAARGTPGQVINFGRDEDPRFAIAPSFGGFMAWYVGLLESGNFSLEWDEDEEAQMFDLADPPTSHFLDGIRKMFLPEK